MDRRSGKKQSGATMPRYWFTTHWPRFKGGRDTLHIYLREEHRDAAPGLAPGDRVLVYEFKSGPSLLLDGGTRIHREVGKGGIICDARIVAPLQPRSSNEAQEIYVDGKKVNWSWIAETADRTMGYLPRGVVNELLGYAAGNYFYGFNGGRGIKELEPEVYARLRGAFIAAKNPR